MKANLDIRYVKLHFTIEMCGECRLPVYKSSMLRGGMGEMLLSKNCIRDRKCEACDFEDECIVRRMMYSKLKIRPKFMSSGDSVGYILECEDYREEFAKGDRIEFNLVLFGNNIVYFNQYLDAFYSLGRLGMGKENAGYEIVSVTNTMKQPIMDGYDIRMDRYVVSGVGDYLDYRLKMLKNGESENCYIKLKSPLSVKYRGEMLDTFSIEGFLESIRRRIFMLCCFEGISIEEKDIWQGALPNVEIGDIRLYKVPRFSFRKNEKMNLKGIKCSAILNDVDEETMKLLVIGELIHAGKNTSFGFGRYRLSTDGR